MDTIQEYKCPNCSGAIQFDSATQNMKCPYCDSEFDVANLKAYDDILNTNQNDDMAWDIKDENTWDYAESDGLCTYVCKSCGGEILADESTAASTCPFCNNPIVIIGKFSGELKPEYIISFKLNKEDAKKALNKFYSGKRLLPKIFKDQNHIDEIKGIYVPFWLCDAQVYVRAHYKATKSRKWSDSSNNYKETSYYSVLRQAELSFNNVPVDASKKMDDDLMESIEPFQFDCKVDFQSAYLAGYLADKYDISSSECIERANTRIKKSSLYTLLATVKNYESVDIENSNIQFKNAKAKYALLPVWILNTSWEGKKYTFAMNGQSGKFVGDLPFDKGLYKKWLFGLIFGISSCIFALSYLMWLIK